VGFLFLVLWVFLFTPWNWDACQKTETKCCGLFAETLSCSFSAGLSAFVVYSN